MSVLNQRSIITKKKLQILAGDISAKTIAKERENHKTMIMYVPDHIWHLSETRLGLCLIYIVDQHHPKV